MRIFQQLFHQKILSFCIVLGCIVSIESLATNDGILPQVEQAKETYYSGNLDGALKLFLPLAKTGHDESQYYLGLIYSTDGWSKRDPSLAISYLLSAADQYYAAAMWQLGQMYETGTGIEKDLLIATDWYRKSNVVDESPVNVRYMKIDKKNTSLQPITAVIDELRKSAMNGDIESQYKLAKTYDLGKLTPRDLTKAFNWYQTAARNGHSYSMFMTGYFYCRGLGVEVDFNSANRWLEQSGRNSTCR